MQSRELNCFNKIIKVCKNRGLDDLANDILKAFGQKYLGKETIKNIKTDTPKTIKYKNKITFFKSSEYAKQCSKCAKLVEIGDPLFLCGKHTYHTLCGIEVLNEAATDNFFYKQWLMKPTQKIEQEFEDETEI